MQTKTCTKCGEEKLLEEFHKSKTGKLGRGSYCKVCNKAYNKNWKAENKEALREYNVEYHKKHYEANKEYYAEKAKKYYEENKELVAEYYKKYREENKEAIREKNKKYREENKEAIREQRKKYREANKEALIEKRKKYREENRSRIRESKRKYERERKASDAVFKLKCNIRNNILTALRKGGWKKTSKTQEILGCDFEFFYEWIENQFEEGMTWENHGEWHLDHIKPLAMAITEQEIMEFCHYSNYQPLWAFDNLSKGSLFEGERHTRKND